MIAPHSAESDYREPLLLFSLPAYLIGGGNKDDNGDNDNPISAVLYGFFWISELYWIEILLLVCLNVVLSTITGIILYKGIVEPKKEDTATAFCLGFGLLLPFWLAWPTFIYQALDLRNLIVKFVVGGVQPTLMLFRILEVVYGCCPPYATTKSLSDFLLYFASVLVFERDETTGMLLKASMSMKLFHLRQFIGLLFLTGAFQSILTPHPDLNVFGPPVASDGWFHLDRMTTWQLYANSFLHAVLFQLYLTTYCEGVTFFWYLVTGYQTKPVMKNPLLGGAIQSPSDFWGRRWNLLVQSVLKGGVYKPFRKYGYSPTISVVATFLASGLFHEWLAHGLFSTACRDDHGVPTTTITTTTTSSCYHPTYGGSMVFFSWQAALIAGEFFFGNTAIVSSVTQSLPLPVRTALIIALGIPLAHFFTEPYVRSDYFRHGQLGLPMIIRVDDDEGG